MQAAPEAPVTYADPSHEDWEEEGRVRAVSLSACVVLSCGLASFAIICVAELQAGSFG